MHFNYGIQLLSKVLFEEYNLYLEMLGFPASALLDTDCIADLASIVTAFYLENWLIEDPKCKMSIRDFSQWGYAGKPVNKDDYDKREIDPTKDQRCRRAYYFYSNMQDQVIQLQTEEKTVPITPAEKEGVGQGSPRNLDYVTLAWCDAWTKEVPEAQVYDSLAFFKKRENPDSFILDYSERKYFVPEILSEQKCKTLAADMQRLYCYLKYLHNLYEKIDNPIHLIEYVAGCMLFQRLEVFARFDLTRRLAEALLYKGSRDFPNAKALMIMYWGRSVKISGLVENVNMYHMDASSHKRWVRTYSSNPPSLDLLHYDLQISTLKELDNQKVTILTCSLFPMSWKYGISIIIWSFPCVSAVANKLFYT